MPTRNKKGQFLLGIPHNKGRQHTAETRAKIGAAFQGRHLTDKHRQKLSAANRGKKYRPMSAIGRLNISLAHRGKRGPRSLETRTRISEAKRGAKCYAWKGGISPINETIRKSLRYKVWREQVFERDGYACVLCGAGGSIQADHIKRFADFPELRFDVANGRTLCVPCHRKTSTYGNRRN